MKGTKHIPKDDNLIEIIHFVTWLRLECDFNSIFLWEYKGKNLTIEQLIKIYRKTNGK